MRPKVLVLSELFWPEGGGAELATYLVTNVLRRAFEVTVVTGSKNPAVPRGVKYVYEPLLARREKLFLWLNVLKLIKAERFRKLICRADIVYIPRLSFPVIPYAKEMGKTVVVHLHDYIPVSYSAAILAPYEEHIHRVTRDDLALECRKGVNYCLGSSLLWWLPKLARKWITQADKVVCVSKRQARIIMDLIPELEDKIEVIYNPLPPELVNRGVHKSLEVIPTFLYIGGDSYVKGFHILLQALRKLGKRGVRAKLILASSYSYESFKALKELGERFRNLEIRVAGRVKYEELLNLYNRAWALIFPSLWEEPLPYAVIESMLVGSIPIASRVGGVPEVVEGTYAKSLMFTPGDFEEVAERLERVSHLSRDQLINIGLELREFVLKKFNGDTIEQHLLKIFSK